MKLERSVKVRGVVPAVAGTVNVILLLVFFLLLSTSFLLQPGVAIEMPASRFLHAALQDPLVVAVTGGAGAKIYFEDREVDLAQLEARLEARRTASDSRQVVVQADAAAPLSLVSQVAELALAKDFAVALAGEQTPRP